VTLKLGVAVFKDHWKWRRSIDHTTFYWSAIVYIALSGTDFELYWTLKKYRDLEI